MEIRQLWKKGKEFCREMAGLGISLHAAGAGYFIALSVFPMLVLLLGMLRYTGLSVDTLNDFLAGILPEALMPSAQRLVRSAYRNTSGAVISFSALVALWSASRGVYGLMRGLNSVYHRKEKRNWLHVRWLSMVYTGLFLSVVVLTLALGVFSTGLVRWLPVSPVLIMLERSAILRLGILFFLQTALFCAMFMALPSRGNGLYQSLPGAMLASGGWLVFSNLYSQYVTYFSGYANVFGSVYAVAMSMLWLYICLCILFFAGAWNERRSEKNKKF